MGCAGVWIAIGYTYASNIVEIAPPKEKASFEIPEETESQEQLRIEELRTSTLTSEMKTDSINPTRSNFTYE